MSTLERVVMRLPDEMVALLDEIALMASNVLPNEVSRAAVVRAALGTWLEIANECDPALIITSIRDARVPRGRKPR